MDNASITRTIQAFFETDWDGATERRSERRQPFYRPVTVSCESGEEFAAFTRDVSPHGLRLLHRRPIPAGPVQIEIQLSTASSIRVAAEIRSMLEGSQIVESHGRCGKVQDPYSFRCQPQVMGAALDLLSNAARTLTIEAGAVTDNPILFGRDGDDGSDSAISGGNFHAQPVAFAADTIAMALCEVGSISERRTAVLIDPKMSGLPPFLTEDSGVNSGLMIPQVTAAALVAENRSLAFPASVESIPTSAGQEDHVSMAPIAARKAGQIARNAAGIVAVELIAAAQGVDFHAPLKTSEKLQRVHSRVRELTPCITSDRYWADDMAALQAAVLAGEIGEFALPSQATRSPI